MKNLILIILAIIFIIGLVFYCTNSRTNTIESYTNKDPLNNKENNPFKPKPCGAQLPKENCPNVLLKKDDKIYLYNANLARVPGINPIMFDTLEDYTEFHEWQKSQNIDCPILFLDTTYDTQNNRVYKVTSNPFSQPEVTLGTDLVRPGNQWVMPLDNANRSPDLAPYNQGPTLPADFDPDNQYIGEITPIDKIFHSTAKKSPNPMDPNWGGHAFTQSKIKEGKYKGNLIVPYTSSGKDHLGKNPALIGGPTSSNINVERLRDDATNPNWVGADQTTRDVAGGLFEGNEVTKYNRAET